MCTTLKKPSDAALYYVMYSLYKIPITVQMWVSEMYGINKQGNPEQYWKPTFLLRTSSITHVFTSYCYPFSCRYSFCLWKTSYSDTDAVYGQYVEYNIIISRGCRVCDSWRKSNISCINPILYVSFACLAEVTHWLLYSAMLQVQHLASFFHKFNFMVKKAFFLLNVNFTIAFLDFVVRVRLASFVNCHATQIIEIFHII
jgi:hypothetical protein